jgi:hypothetical protein
MCSSRSCIILDLQSICIVFVYGERLGSSFILLYKVNSNFNYKSLVSSSSSIK